MADEIQSTAIATTRQQLAVVVRYVAVSEGHAHEESIAIETYT